MDKLQVQKDLIRRIRSRFPIEASKTDEWLTERGSDQAELEEMTYAWVEAFADRTKEAVQGHDAVKVKELTGFIAEQYRVDPDALHDIIDVAYAENIMWGLDDEDRVWAWPYIADEVKQFYEAMWGNPCSNKAN